MDAKELVSNSAKSVTVCARLWWRSLVRKFVGVVLGVFAVLIMFNVVLGHFPSSRSSSSAISSPSAPEAPAAAPAVSEPPPSSWTYDSNVDEITGKSKFYACTTSAEGMKLCFRKIGNEFDSLISFPDHEEQFLCLEDGCGTKVKVDDHAAFTIYGTETAEGDTHVMFLNSPQKLLSAVRRAKELKLQPPLFERGTTVYHFNVSGLNWSH